MRDKLHDAATAASETLGLAAEKAKEKAAAAVDTASDVIVGTEPSEVAAHKDAAAHHPTAPISTTAPATRVSSVR